MQTRPASSHARAARARRHAHHARALRAFTLVELMIVVAIVGILAVLGVVGYRKLILAAHTSEATQMVQAIRVAQESYHAEAQTYVSSSNVVDGTSNLFPTANQTPSNIKNPWIIPTTITCSATSPAPACMGLLPVHVDGPVLYGYATVAGLAGTAPPQANLPNGTVLTAGTAASPVDYYWITAAGNPQNLSANTTWSYVVANSFVNDLYVKDQ